MDFGTLMMSQGMPSGIVPGMNNQMGIVPQQDANGLEFVNLLNLVEGMETSELSSASDGEQNFANAAVELKDEVGEKVSSDKNAALAGLAMAGIDLNAGLIGKSVGQDVPAKAELLETAKVPTNEIVAPQNIFLNAPAAKPLQADTRLDSESVAAWTAAFAANEVKDVQVSQAAPEGSDLSKQHLAASNESQMLRGSESPLELVKPESLKKEAVLVAAAPVVATSKSESVQSQSQPQVQAKSAIGPVAAREPAKEGFVSMTASVERVAANDSSIAPFAQREAVNAEKIASEQPKKSLQAKDFLMDRAEIAAGQSGGHAKTVLATAVASKGFVTKTSDQNVIDFVSDKVATLQAAGGGTLRVGLDTKDMGQIEIKVTMRAGRVDVKISGESPEITRQLEAGRSELTAKLEKHVELGDLNISRGQFTRVDDTKQLLASSGSLRLSEDLVKNSVRESVETLSRLTDNPRSERLESLRNTSPLARSQESSSTDNGFARDERREQALEQWANSSQMRQSA